MADRIDKDERGAIDDVVIEGVETFRLERMNRRQWWLALYRDGKPAIVLRFYSRAKIKVSRENG